LLHATEYFRILERRDPSRGQQRDGLLRRLHTRRGRQDVAKIERVLTLLPDSTAMYAKWKRLVVAHNVPGSKVHDARLVAAMNAHGVHRILTFDAGDFTRYEVEILDPTAVASCPDVGRLLTLDSELD
jgi:predicted nucleic acid-binding protein